MRRLILVSVAMAMLGVSWPAAARAGAIDYTFRPARANFVGQDIGQGIVVQSDGKLVMAGYTERFSKGEPLPADFAVARFTKNGALDRTFSGDGKVTIPFAGDDGGFDVALAPGGKLIVVGYTLGEAINESRSGDLAVARLDRNGKLDPTFGTGGKAVVEVSGLNDLGFAAAVQPDGAVVIASSTLSDLTAAADRTEHRYGGSGQLVRLLPNGLPDPTFGVAGRVPVKVSGGWDQISSVRIQRDGAIVVAGTTAASDDAPMDVFVNRYLATGATDPTFGTAGSTLLNFGSKDMLGDIQIGKDGKIVVAVGTHRGFGAVRLAINGLLDKTFSKDGRAEFVFPREGWTRAVHVQSDGKILIGGSWLMCFPGGFCLPFANVVRFTKSGAVDTGFGSRGAVRMTDMWWVTDLEAQGSKVIAGGWGPGAGYNDFIAHRLTL